MKMQVRLRNLFILMVSIPFLIPVSAVYAKGHGHGGPHGQESCDGPSRHPGPGQGGHFMQMKKKLNLTDDQSKLLEHLQKTRRAFMDRACRNNRDGCRKSKLQKRAFHLFRAELAAEQPDFNGAARKLKPEYHGDYPEEFNAMVDARAAFMSSLTSEQRDRLLEMKPRGGKHGPGHGKKNQHAR